MKSIVSSKGQITIPAAVRGKLGLLPGTHIKFEIQRQGVLLRKGSTGEHPVDRPYGALPLRKRVDALIDEMRGPRPKR